MKSISAWIAFWLAILGLMVLRVDGQLPPSCYVSNTTYGLPLSATYTCPDHFYCPNTTASDPASIPQYCPPSIKCQITRLLAGRCLEPQGKYEPQVCPAGYYCPTFSNISVCPDGYYCPLGSMQPLQCQFMSSCPEKSKIQVTYGGLVICFIIDIVMAFSYILVKYINRVNMKKHILLHSQANPSNPEKISSSKVAPEKQIQIDMDNARGGNGNGNGNGNKEISPVLKGLLQGYAQAFQFSVPGSSKPTMPKLDFRFEEMGLTLKNGTKILEGVSGSIRAGRLVAIMGPSGAGKTTFMNVLMGKVNRTKGSLFINDEEVEITKLKKIIGFVPQEDIMLREMTVLENIYHSARVRLPDTWSNQQVSDFVDSVIKTLGLERVKHSLIGDESTRGISGGQRKRVNIGMALAGAPLALFLDEPTSGLDSAASLSVAEALKEITCLGVNVITVLHQPRYEIFEKFDDILLIVPGGRTAYLGPQNRIIEYFKDLGYEFGPLHNPADILMDILAGGKDVVNTTGKYYTPRELADVWIEKSSSTSFYGADGKPITSKPLSPTNETNLTKNATRSVLSIREVGKLSTSRNYANFIWQAWLCHNRSLVQQFRRINSLTLEIGVAFLAGALMGLSIVGTDGETFVGTFVYPMTLLSSSSKAWLVPLLSLLIHLAVGLAGAPAGVKTFGEEKTVYWREAAAGHSRFGYYLGKTISVTYRYIITSLHFVSIFYWLGTPQISFARMYLFILADFYCVFGLAAVVSMLVKRDNAALLAVVICLFAGVFCGFGPSLADAKKWGVLFIWQSSYGRWGSEALFTEELKNFKGIYDVNAAADAFGYILDQYAFDIGMMAVIGSIYRVVAFVLLLITHRDKQK